LARSFHIVTSTYKVVLDLKLAKLIGENTMRNTQLTLNTINTVFGHTLKLASPIFTKIQQHYTFFANVGFSQWEVEKR
jgi:chromatin remodeling complex protein RSC6